MMAVGDAWPVCEGRIDVLLDFSMVLAITAASVGHVTVGLRSEAKR